MQVLGAFLPAGEVVLGVDDTIERRWGPKIKARGLYRDPVRSSRGHFVRASGLRWLSLMVMVPISWAGRRWDRVNPTGPFSAEMTRPGRHSQRPGRYREGGRQREALALALISAVTALAASTPIA